jgi:uncharacterized membrane protein YeaQ/YmgE (transglycosylase-associated protein family)
MNISLMRIFLWWLLFDTAAAAGKLQSPFLLIVAIVGAWIVLKIFPLWQEPK